MNRYAALVSLLLATLLLTRQERYPMELAMRRLSLLSERIRNLTAAENSELSEETLALIREAAAALLTQLDSFTAGLQR